MSEGLMLSERLLHAGETAPSFLSKNAPRTVLWLSSCLPYKGVNS